tara:strand:+ start:383 stop:565 length:183 start_codon:yes stop_codon:yes gene_type:complete
MNWEEKLKQFLVKESIDQKDYDEFIKIRETLKSEEEIDKYMQYGEGIYLLLDENVLTGDD